MKTRNTIVAIQTQKGHIIYTEVKNPMNATLRNSILVTIVLLLISIISFAKANKFNSYQQITDKQIIVESRTGEQVLFSAYSDYSVGVKYLSSNEKVELITPSEVNLNSELTGSIYVEELDELFHITTTNPNGMVIKIDRKTLEITFIEKGTNNLIYSEIPFNNKVNENFKSSYVVERYETITWRANAGSDEENIGDEKWL